jgi:hypothetical protein
MAQNAHLGKTHNMHLGKTHNVQPEKVGNGVISTVKFTKVCLKGKFTAKFQSTAQNVE